jgi:hypothetical protein
VRLAAAEVRLQLNDRVAALPSKPACGIEQQIAKRRYMFKGSVALSDRR